MNKPPLDQTHQKSAAPLARLLGLPPELTLIICEFATSDDAIRIVHSKPYIPLYSQRRNRGFIGLLNSCYQMRVCCLQLRINNHIMRPGDLNEYLDTFYPTRGVSDDKIAEYRGQLSIDIGRTESGTEELNISMSTAARLNVLATGFKLRFVALGQNGEETDRTLQADNLNTVLDSLRLPPILRLGKPVINESLPPNITCISLYTSMVLIIPSPDQDDSNVSMPLTSGSPVVEFTSSEGNAMRFEIMVNRVQWLEYAKHKYGEGLSKPCYVRS